jgi:hypothetical protein
VADEARAIGIIRVAGTAALILFVAFQFVNPKRPVVANTPGFSDPVAGFELASRPEDVLGILGPVDDPRRPAAVRSMELGTYLDFFFLLAYPAFYVGIALLLHARGASSRGLTGLLLGLAVIMATGDALENREILRLCRMVDPVAMMPALARLGVFTHAKWHAVFGASVLVVPGLWRQGGVWRWSAPCFALGAMLGFASIVHPPAIEWTIAPLGLAWTIVYVGALRRQSAQKATPLATTARLPQV